MIRHSQRRYDCPPIDVSIMDSKLLEVEIAMSPLDVELLINRTCIQQSLIKPLHSTNEGPCISIIELKLGEVETDNSSLEFCSSLNTTQARAQSTEPLRSTDKVSHTFY